MKQLNAKKIEEEPVHLRKNYRNQKCKKWKTKQVKKQLENEDG
jgi:hypothetical protein